MKSLICLLLLFIVSSFSIFSQVINTNWVKGIGSNRGTAFQSDLNPLYLSNNNSTTTFIQFENELDVDPSINSQLLRISPNQEIAFALFQLDRNGDLEFGIKALEFKTEFNSGDVYFHQDVLDRKFVYGWIGDSVDLNPDTAIVDMLIPDFSNGIILNSFIQIFNSQGSLINVFKWQDNLLVDALTTDQLGNIFVGGLRIGVVDADPSSANTFLVGTNTDSTLIIPYVMKLNTSGNVIWYKEWANTSTNDSTTLLVGRVENLYYDTINQNLNIKASFLKDSIEINPNGNSFIAVKQTSLGERDFFHCVLDSSGNFIDGFSYHYFYSNVLPYRSLNISADRSGKPIIYGFFRDSMLFNYHGNLDTVRLEPNQQVNSFIYLPDSTNSEIYLLKSPAIRLRGLEFNSNNELYLSGVYTNTVDFDFSSNTFFSTAIPTIENSYVVKYSYPPDTLKWFKSFSQGINSSYDIKVGRNDTVFVKGTFIRTDSTDFDPPNGLFLPNHSSFYDPNAVPIESVNNYIAKLSECFVDVDTISASACDSLLSPSGSAYWTTSGTYFDRLPNARGCDSVLIVNLTIGAVDTSVSQQGVILTANRSGVNYQWLDCNNGNSRIIGANSQTFIAPVNGRYALEITEGSCIDTSSCYTVISVGLNENPLENVQIAPNPNNGWVNVLLPPLNSSTELVLRNSMGAEIKRISIGTQSTYQMEIEGSKGLYFLEIINMEGRIVKRLIKN